MRQPRNPARTITTISLDKSMFQRIDALKVPLSAKMGVDLDRTKIIRIALDRALKDLEAEHSLPVA